MSRTNNRNSKPIEQYDHKGEERINNPPVGLVTADTDRETGKKSYTFDPHLDPQLQWAGKAEHTSFDVPTVSLHVHERIDPRTIIEAVRNRNVKEYVQLSLFESSDENPPLRIAIEFYRHKHNWSNRLIAGDSLLVMNSLLEKEGMAGKVQMIYIDPPYGIKYGSNFQPFVNKKKVKDGTDEDLTQEPEQIKAFRDTWELGIHSYLTYMRDRLLLANKMLHETGSIFVQINDENVHLVKSLLDEIFGPKNFVAIITYKTATTQNANRIQRLYDHILWYGRSENFKFRRLFRKRTDQEIENIFNNIDGKNGKRYKAAQLKATLFEKEIQNLKNAGRLTNNGKYGKRYEDDFEYTEYDNVWTGTIISTFSKEKVYAVQTSTTAIQRCMLMVTDPGDLVFDPTCGSGTTAYVAEQQGRRWVSCDTSRVAITLAKQRIMTALFDYYELAHPAEGVGSGLRYKSVPHITLKNIFNNDTPAQEVLYDQPFIDNSKARVSGPFTVEAVPAPVVKPISVIKEEPPADESVVRSGGTLRQSEWKDELLRTGIRGKSGESMEFTRVETLSGTRWLHADGATKETSPQRVVISFGPEHAPLEQRQVELAIEEARKLVPKPKVIVFAAFQFDPEASKDIDETDWPGVTLLKVQMNADLLTEDLKKQRSSNESFWLIGQPDVRLERIKDGENKGKYRVEVLGFDYYNTRGGTIESGGTEKIAMWMLDTDYDGRSLFPRQVFFPMAGEKDGWSRLARNLKAEIDKERIEAYRGTISLPFDIGDNKRVAAKIVDDRGIESLKIIEVG